jgi:hypothetical protein
MNAVQAKKRAQQLWGRSVIITNARGKNMKIHPEIGEPEWDVEVGTPTKRTGDYHELDTEGHVTCHMECGELEAKIDDGVSA